MFLLINTNWCHCLCIWRKTQVSLSRHSWSTGKGMSSSFGRFRHHSLQVKGADSFWFHAENCKDLIWDSNIFILTRRQKAKYVLRLSILCLYFVFKPHNEHCSRSHLSDYKYVDTCTRRRRKTLLKGVESLADSCWFLRLNLILPFTDRNDISVWC